MKSFNYHKNLKPRRALQSGFTLVELLIASTLGLFIIGGVITSFMGTKDSEKMRSAVSEMDSNARVALEVLRKSISLAGYSSMRNIQGFNKPFYSESDGAQTDENCKAGVKMHTSGAVPGEDQYTKDSGGATPTDGRGDVLTAVYLADNPCAPGKASCASAADINPKAMVYVDCAGGGSDRDAQTVSCSTDESVGMGQTDAMKAKIYNTFYLGSGSDDNKRVLYCRGNRGGAQPLVEDIEYLQFLYGVTRSDGNTEFLRANTVEANNEWSNVTSVRVGLLMRSSKQILKKDADKDRYILLDRNVEITDKRRLYRAFTTTINLPNRNRGQVL